MQEDKKRVYQSLIWSAVLVSLLWIVKAVELFSGTTFVDSGLYPRSISGAMGIFTSPFIHKDLDHLISNSVPLFVLSFIIFTSYRFVALRAYALIFVLTGLWVWVAAREAYHIGASGIVYGLVSFLFFMGIFRWDKRSIALSLLVTFLYGGLIWGIFPYDISVSWESHFLGAIAGIFSAILFWKENLPPKPISRFDQEEEDLGELPYWKYEVEGGLKQEERPTVNYMYIIKPSSAKDEKQERSVNDQ